METETLVEAYKRGFQDGLNAQKNKPEAYWIRKRVNERHYHYYCSKCGYHSRYKKGNFCSDCGRKMKT